jgi:hypothetical protein
MQPRGPAAGHPGRAEVPEGEQPSSDTIVCLSIVPADGASKPGNLAKDQHVRDIRRWKEALGRAGVTWFLGASDWSFNEHAEDRYPGHWSHHLYGFAATNDQEELKKALQRQFPKTDVIPRPVISDGMLMPWHFESRNGLRPARFSLPTPYSPEANFDCNWIS